MAINLPQKPRAGFHSIQEIVRAVNGVIDYIASFSITGQKPIRVHRTMFQTEIGIDLENSEIKVTGETYKGFFKVILSDGNCLIVDGLDDAKSYAGCAYYNGKKVWCNRGEVSFQSGYLCLKITKHENYSSVQYGYENDIPDMPNLNDGGGMTASYPLAYCTEIEGEAVVQQLNHGLPQLWCFGNCESEEE